MGVLLLPLGDRELYYRERGEKWKVARSGHSVDSDSETPRAQFILFLPFLAQ